MRILNKLVLGAVGAFCACSVAWSVELPAPVTDPLLGEPFKIRAFDAGEGGQYHATLIHYTPEKDTSWRYYGKVLYIHGFNDYYFQRELAQKLDSAHYEFYAIDLHKYGRSLRKGERVGEVFDVSEYFAELDSAIAAIRGDGWQKVTLVAHSTGGLIATLYAAARENGANLNAVVLNSPFLEMNMNAVARNVGVPILSALGKFFPGVDIPRGNNTNYGESLHQSARGEWEFDTTLKTLGSIPVNFAWTRAIHKAHVKVQEGLRIKAPILVMHSSCSVDSDGWDDNYMHCDGVLDVEHIRRYGANLGPVVTLAEIEGGVHDLFLSQKPAREKAYDVMFDFLRGLRFRLYKVSPAHHVLSSYAGSAASADSSANSVK